MLGVRHDILLQSISYIAAFREHLSAAQKIVGISNVVVKELKFTKWLLQSILSYKHDGLLPFSLQCRR